MTKTMLFIPLFLLTLTTGCATQRSQVVPYAQLIPSSRPVQSSHTAQLKNGMTPAEVQAILGPPTHVESWTESLLWTYMLSESEKEEVRTTVKFDQKTQTLKDWQTIGLNNVPQELSPVEAQAFEAQAFGVQAPLTSGYSRPLSDHVVWYSRPTYTYKAKTTVKHHKDGRTTYKTKIKRKY